MTGRLQGKVAIVTGAGRGIGRAEAQLLAAEGARVLVNDFGGGPAGEGSDNSPADAVVAEIKAHGGDAAANYGNVASMADGEAMVKQALDTWGRLDILVNNAGILRDKMVFNMSEAEWDAVIAVHLKGHFTVTKHAALIFRQQRSGRIVNTSSGSGLGNMGQANYSAAKEGIIGLTRTLALDLGRYGVTANAIRPIAGTRLTISPQLREAMERARAAGGRAAPEEANNPLARLEQLKPDFVAQFVVYLCTDAAANINGRDFSVGGDEVSLMSLPERQRSIYREGGWDLTSLERVFNSTIALGLTNPLPPEPSKNT